jgi:thiamine transport system permease protein
VAYPFVVRAVSPVLRKLPASLPEAARSLGAGPWQLFFRVELPLLKGALITGAAFAFGISVGEINATLMLSPPGVLTMPLAVYRLIGSYNFAGACAMGTVLMLACFLAFLAIETLGKEPRR